jgi:Leucine Rich repeats (2 copies)
MYVGGLCRNQSLFLLTGVGFAVAPLFKYASTKLSFYEWGELLIVVGLVLTFFSVVRLLATARAVALQIVIIVATLLASTLSFRIADHAEARLARLAALGIDVSESEAEGRPHLRAEDLAEAAVILGTLTALRTLNLSEASVADLAPLKGLTSLQTLDLSETQAADLAPLKGLTGLQTLNLSATQVADLTPLEGLTALKTLDLSNTHVTGLAPLKGLTGLQTLNLSATQVADLTPLEGLTELETLDLSNTHVTDLAPLKGLAALQTLNLSGTSIVDLDPVQNVPALKVIIGAPDAEKEKLNDSRRQKGLPLVDFQ